jgi:hypothetical protein
MVFLNVGIALAVASCIVEHCGNLMLDDSPSFHDEMMVVVALLCVVFWLP